MKTYIGTKIVQAERPDQGPLDRDKEQDGYKVVYPNGYESWSPREVFDEAYTPLDKMSFGHTIVMLKLGKKVARAGWNGKGMWLTLVQAGQWQVSTDVPGMNDAALLTFPWIGMRTSQASFGPWLASQTDMLADDWTVIDAEGE